MHISKCTSFGCKFKEIITREGSSSTTLLNSMLDNLILGWYQALQMLNNMCIKINALPLHIIPSYTWIIWADEWDKLHSLLLVCFVFFGCQIFCMKGKMTCQVLHTLLTRKFTCKLNYFECCKWKRSNYDKKVTFWC